MGLQGMINKMIEICDILPPNKVEKEKEKLYYGDRQAMSRLITYVENNDDETREKLLKELREKTDREVPVLGITGTGGAGKSSLTDELIRRFRSEERRVGK